MQKLYEIAEEIRNLEELIQDVTMPQELIRQAMDTVEGSLSEKVEGICKYIAEKQNDVLGLDNEIKRLQARKKTAENTIVSIKGYVFEQLKSLKMDSVKTNLFSVRIQLSNPSINILDEKKIPRRYFVKQLPTLDKRELLIDLKAGTKIRGCEIKQSESLRIK